MIITRMKFPDLAAKLERDSIAVGKELLVAMQTNRGLLFDAQGAYNGHQAWDPLVLRSGQILARRGALKKSIAPANSKGNAGPDGIATLDAGIATVGTNVAYAAMMNWGTTKMPDGVLRPTHAKALRIPVPGGQSATDDAKMLRGQLADESGKKHKRTTTSHNKRTGKDEQVIFRKFVKIPARRFDTLTAQDRRDFAEALQAAVAEVLRG